MKYRGYNKLALFFIFFTIIISCEKETPEPPVGESNYKQPLIIGDSYAGGIIFYVDNTGDHGLVCAPSDQSSGAEWGCYDTYTEAYEETVGTGAQNTILIESVCTTSGTAADICANLVLNGYSDWFLPSIDELMLMKDKLYDADLGSFSTQYYWSSTEYNSQRAIRYFFSHYGDWDYDSKEITCRVRAVRAF